MFHKTFSLYKKNIIICVLIFLANKITKQTAICFYKLENSKGSL